MEGSSVRQTEITATLRVIATMGPNEVAPYSGTSDGRDFKVTFVTLRSSSRLRFHAFVLNLDCTRRHRASRRFLAAELAILAPGNCSISDLYMLSCFMGCRHADASARPHELEPILNLELPRSSRRSERLRAIWPNIRFDKSPYPPRSRPLEWGPCC